MKILILDNMQISIKNINISIIQTATIISNVNTHRTNDNEKNENNQNDNESFKSFDSNNSNKSYSSPQDYKKEFFPQHQKTSLHNLDSFKSFASDNHTSFMSVINQNKRK